MLAEEWSASDDGIITCVTSCSHRRPWISAQQAKSCKVDLNVWEIVTAPHRLLLEFESQAVRRGVCHCEGLLDFMTKELWGDEEVPGLSYTLLPSVNGVNVERRLLCGEAAVCDK